jgi:hypothetical protein
MSEIHRCLAPGGIFLAVTPAFPNAEAFQDPTHVNIISKDTIRYFAGSEPWAKLTGYGFTGSFKVITQTWLRGSGPFSTSSLTFNLRQLSNVERYRRLLKLSRRIFYAARNGNPTHLLWVLSKS